MRKPIFCLILIVFILSLSALPGPTQAASVPTHYVFARPIPRAGYTLIERGFPYGWTRNGTSPVHHGVDFPNPRGMAVLAAGDGTIQYAGNDTDNVVGPQPNFYGNIIIIQHDMAAPEGGGLFTLYGHLQKVLVQTGQRVKQGQKIGTVGSSGIAIGTHLHFEVRVGNPQDYNAVRNPELWYPPKPGTGTIIGRMVDSNGNIAMGMRFTLSTKVKVIPGWTYADPSMHSDPTYGENFVMGDILAGCWRLRVKGDGPYAYDEPLCISAGQTVFVDVKLKPF